jgi:hypothetical protein
MAINVERSGSLDITGSKSQHLEWYCRGGPGSVPGQCMWDLSRTKWHWYKFLSRYVSSRVNYHSASVQYSYPATVLFFKRSVEILIVFSAALLWRRKPGCCVTLRRVRRIAKSEYWLRHVRPSALLCPFSSGYESAIWFCTYSK